MDNSQIIIIGANGQLGLALQQRYPGARPTDSSTLDITDRIAVDNYNWHGIKYILNAAAYTNVDGAESSDGRIAAWRVNAIGVANLVHAANTHDCTLVHISSEYVFDGTKTPHTEEEPFSPLGVYAQSKAAGDIAAALTPQHYILRTSWVIGDGKNFVRTMLGLAEKGISPAVVADQIGRPTFTGTLVDAIDHLLSVNAPFGTYNVSNEGEPASWADITRAIFELSGHTALTVKDTTTVEYFAAKPDAAPRPLQSTLLLDKIKAVGLNLRDWHDDLKTYIQNEITRG